MRGVSQRYAGNYFPTKKEELAPGYVYVCTGEGGLLALIGHATCLSLTHSCVFLVCEAGVMSPFSREGHPLQTRVPVGRNG